MSEDPFIKLAFVDDLRDDNPLLNLAERVHNLFARLDHLGRIQQPGRDLRVTTLGSRARVVQIESSGLWGVGKRRHNAQSRKAPLKASPIFSRCCRSC